MISFPPTLLPPPLPLWYLHVSSTCDVAASAAGDVERVAGRPISSPLPHLSIWYRSSTGACQRGVTATHILHRPVSSANAKAKANFNTQWPSSSYADDRTSRAATVWPLRNVERLVGPVRSGDEEIVQCDEDEGRRAWGGFCRDQIL